MSNADLIERLRVRISGEPKQRVALDNEAADALELADKRIAELERNYLDSVEVNTALQHGLYEKDAQIASLKDAASFNFEQYQDAAFLLCEANEKLAVAREALKDVVSWSQLRTVENINAETDLVGECVPIRLTGLKACVEALAQIGGEDAR